MWDREGKRRLLRASEPGRFDASSFCFAAAAGFAQAQGEVVQGGGEGGFARARLIR
jgi:hypothetical protein